MMTLKQDNPLSGEVEAKVDDLLKAYANYVMDLFINTVAGDFSKKPSLPNDENLKTAFTKLLLEQRIDPFDFVEPCAPDCSQERHAYHQGQWDMATRITAKLNQLDKENNQ